VTGAAAAGLRTFAFGDLDTGVWGIAASWGATTVASFASVPTAHAADDADEWFVAADGLELRFAPLGEPGPLAPQAAGLAGVAQLCTVDGAIHRDGSEQDVACLGMHGELALPLPAAETGRAVSAWFGPDYAFALASLRPAGARGHDRDAIACTILDDGTPLAVDEPRFSTAYDAAGVPSRSSLEIWLEDLKGEGEESRPQYPRRLSGEATGERARLKADGVELHAQLFRWHARGLEGAGVYVLINRAGAGPPPSSA
jgi:hypothetical protein